MPRCFAYLALDCAANTGTLAGIHIVPEAPRLPSPLLYSLQVLVGTLLHHVRPKIIVGHLQVVRVKLSTPCTENVLHVIVLGDVRHRHLPYLRTRLVHMRAGLMEELRLVAGACRHITQGACLFSFPLA